MEKPSVYYALYMSYKRLLGSLKNILKLEEKFLIFALDTTMIYELNSVFKGWWKNPLSIMHFVLQADSS